MKPPVIASRLTMGWQIALAWAAISLLLLAINASAIATMAFPDQDDTLRLIQVRDWLGGQSWFDVTQYRLNPPDGAPMHWSRLIDIPIALGLLVLEPIFGQVVAEKITLAAIPLLTLLCIMQLLGRLACRLFDRSTALFACFVIALSVPVMEQVRPMRIDHHAWQIVMAMIAFAAAFDPRPKRSGLITGLALALWLTISIEGLPMAAAFMALYAMQWIGDGAQRHRLLYAMLALAGGCAALHLATSLNPVSFQVYCDALSPLHIAIFGSGACAIAAMAMLNPHNRIILIASFAAIGAAALATILSAAPECSRGAFADMDPLVRSFWYDNISEGKPIWTQDVRTVCEILALPILALLALWKMQRSDAPLTTAQQFSMAVLVLASLAIAVFVERAGAVSNLIALPAGVWLIRLLLFKARTVENGLQRIAATAGVFMLLVPGHIAFAASHLTGSNATEQAVRLARNCALPEHLAALDSIAPAHFMVPTDSGPALLYATHHAATASGHHRNHIAMRNVIRSFASNPEVAHAIINRHKVEYIAYCPGLYGPLVYQRDYPDGLLARLEKGDSPEWLTAVDVEGTQGLKLWRVKSPR